MVLGANDTVEEGIARTALTQFLHRGFQTPTWSIFHENDPIRIAYVGTPTANLAYLVSQESPHHGDASLHFAFPSIRPVLPWKPSPSLPILKWYSNITDDISMLPEKEIHPGFPIVDEAEFRAAYSDQSNPPPLLLPQSILLAGAHVCNHPKVVESRSLVKVALFHRAKALFDLHYENNREHLIQAALFFTWHFEGADDIGANAYYWVGVACRLAFGLGMHRDLSSSARSVIPVQDRRIQRRLWWTLFRYDIMASLHHGRPLMINDDDCDQPPLAEEDFIEVDGRLNNNVHIKYCIHHIKLCYHIIEVMRLYSPGSLRRHNLGQISIESSRETLSAQLERWYIQLPQEINNPARHPQDFWCVQLHLHYNLSLLQLYRASHLSTKLGFTSAYLIPSPKTIEICHNAASASSQLLSSILMAAKIQRCSFLISTLLLAAAIQISSKAGIAKAGGSQILAQQTRSRLESLFPIMLEVAKYWPIVEAIHRLFVDALQNMAVKVDEQQEVSVVEHSRGLGYDNIAGYPAGNLDPQIGRDADFLSRCNLPGISTEDWNSLFGTWDDSAFIS